MRRADREVTGLENLISIMRKCDVCRVALNGPEGYPYIVPLNFGLHVSGDRVELFFHGALEGTKYILMERDSRAGFEMDCSHRLVVTDPEQGSCTMEYESVAGYGHVEPVPDEEKYDALCILMEHYRPEGYAFNRAVVSRTRVFRLVVEHMTGKRRMIHTPS